MKYCEIVKLCQAELQISHVLLLSLAKDVRMLFLPVVDDVAKNLEIVVDSLLHDKIADLQFLISLEGTSILGNAHITSPHILLDESLERGLC